ncbi:winged helix-turn-helix transcriptional regulator [Amycolatopsis azurea]|uniref:Transcriptional regulator n=1 Tax=Amycolatopsis azurea DSM 43854 TaxID=1238180 RepID=M2NTI9_9PSEU|nr:helix-turn-helix domain-containing protein [Amycolatopsis azurea]EMD25769.1 Transcriptional regulator, HxlR family [Amycolatopsis azurea DSM 43854]OOC05937.1 transcriptional regulator [Amycolatopsis azurea DSM 43854]
MSQGNNDVTAQARVVDPEKLEVCTVLEVINRISGKWAIGILLEATRGPVRFTELERSVEGISRRMLTLTLRNLERDGLLVRTVYPTVPPKVEYEATAMAKELYASLSGLLSWAERHREGIAASRVVYDEKVSA